MMHIRFKSKFEKPESWCPDIFMIIKIIIIILKNTHKKAHKQANKQNKTKLKKTSLEMKPVVRSIVSEQSSEY